MTEEWGEREKQAAEKARKEATEEMGVLVKCLEGERDRVKNDRDEEEKERMRWDTTLGSIFQF